MNNKLGLFLLLAGFVIGCNAPAEAPPAEAAPPAVPSPETAPVEATSLLGAQLLRPELEEEFGRQQRDLLAQARADLEARPDDPMSHIWVGRRTAYLGRYREAIAIYTGALGTYPEEARLYRHRGHRYISVRELDNAVVDLERAVELLRGQEPRVEPDGLPNAENKPLGNTHTAAFYHLGLAHYLRGDFEAALAAYREGLSYAENDDMVVAFTHWLYMTLRRLERDDEAAAVLEPVSADMEIIEDHDYHRLVLMYRGEMTPEELLGDDDLSVATLGYGIGNYHFYNGDREKAIEVFQRVVDGESWASFGYIAAEAELARLQGGLRRGSQAVNG